MRDSEFFASHAALGQPSRRVVLRWAPLLWLGGVGSAGAQVLSEAVQKATSVDAVLSSIRAKPEWSSHLSLDLPDVVLPGEQQVRFGSEIAGTAWLLLLRGRKGVTPPLPPPGHTAELALVVAQPFAAGVHAAGSVKVDIATTQYLTLLALSRGRWYYVEREVKVARRP